MAQKLIIDIFKPPDFEKSKLNLDYLNNVTGKNFVYASMGRFALYHILKSLEVKGQILVPAYICETVLLPLKILRINPIFYDLDPEDLNASMDSIEFLSRKHNVKSVLVASMYGNAANLTEIENFCREKGIKLIDDAAQSLGAKLDNRYIGTFGDAGFFSLSPGKPAAGHMGAFFWTSNKEYYIKRTKHPVYHYISYLDFYFNRLKIYEFRSLKLTKFITLAKKALSSHVKIMYDDIADFESVIVGGILNLLLNGGFNFRKTYFNEFITRFEENPYFRVIKSIRGVPNNHKFIVLANSREHAQRFSAYLIKNKIFSLNGYPLLTSDLAYLPNSEEINKRVVEIPMENEKHKMAYLFDVISDFKG